MKTKPLIALVLSGAIGAAAGFGVVAGLAAHAEASGAARAAEQAALVVNEPRIAPWVVLAAADPAQSEAVDAGVAGGEQPVAVTPPPAAEASAPDRATALSPWNPIGWDWTAIGFWTLTIIGALLAALRPIAALTKWTFDDRLVVKLEWLLALLLRIFAPPQVRAASLGGGKSPDLVASVPGGSSGSKGAA